MSESGRRVSVVPSVRGGGKALDRSLLGKSAEPEAQAARAVIMCGEIVRRLRTAKGWTQAELAGRLGTTQAHLSELERGLGKQGPTISTLYRIVAELGDSLVVGTRGGHGYDGEAVRLATEAAICTVVGKVRRLQVQSLNDFMSMVKAVFSGGDPQTEAAIHAMVLGYALAVTGMEHVGAADQALAERVVTDYLGLTATRAEARKLAG